LKTRYFAEIAYKGTEYSGWQIQPNAITVQEVFEKSISKIIGYNIPVMGCGRTDAGVHASQFYLHFDLDESHNDLDKLTYQLNAILPKSISVFRVFKVDNEAHVRFDATKRSYVYKIHFGKNPFEIDSSFCVFRQERFNFELMNEAAKLILLYEDFFPFCKTKTEVFTFKCTLKRSEWIEIGPSNWEYHVSANRFLRGMVRLLVGMCLNVGSGKLSLEELKLCMDQQQRLPHAWSVPAEGLYLCEVIYPKS